MEEREAILLCDCPTLKLFFQCHYWPSSEMRFSAKLTHELSSYSSGIIELCKSIGGKLSKIPCMNPFLLHWKLCWCSLLFSKPFKDIIIKKKKKTQYENESQWLLKRPTVRSLIASRELSLIWKRFCLFRVLCQSLTYTSFPTPKKIHKSAQRPPRYKFNTEKRFAGFVFQLEVFGISILISLRNRKFRCTNAVLIANQQCI